MNRQVMATRTSVVLAALVANAAITLLKFLAFLLTGSVAMLSEAYHSISDTGNQVFLLVGIRFGQREPTELHPFGYGKAQFFYSFLVSVLLFGIAGWESARRGIEALRHGEAHLTGTVEILNQVFPAVYVSYAVLIGAFGFETWALLKARKAMKRQIDERGWSGYREAFRETSDVTTLTAFTEDSIALAGVTLAFFGILLTEMTGNPVFDAVAAFLIGLLLMGFAVALAWQNKRLLLGESLSAARVANLHGIVADHDGVDGVVDFRTVYFGPESAIVTADVAFGPDLDTETIDRHITAIEDELRAADPHVDKVYIEPEIGQGPADEQSG